MYSHKKGRGIVNKEFGTRKIFIHKHASNDWFLQRIKKSLVVVLMMLAITLRMGVALQSQVEKT